MSNQKEKEEQNEFEWLFQKLDEYLKQSKEKTAHWTAWIEDCERKLQELLRSPSPSKNEVIRLNFLRERGLTARVVWANESLYLNFFMMIATRMEILDTRMKGLEKGAISKEQKEEMESLSSMLKQLREKITQKHEAQSEDITAEEFFEKMWDREKKRGVIV